MHLEEEKLDGRRYLCDRCGLSKDMACFTVVPDHSSKGNDADAGG